MNSLAYYPQILRLLDDEDAQRRGYRFEQILREILPWDNRPPVSISARTEQLDAFFEWNSWHFLVEAKAKDKTITAGSHDWEDFALKMRNRSGQCIGLFCSVSPVNDEVLQEAHFLNRQGAITIVIHGPCWTELSRLGIPLPEFLRYMVFVAKALQVGVPTSFELARDWIYNRDTAIARLTPICQRQSSTFLRRHKLTRHDQVYIPRAIDDAIVDFAKLLRPSHLANLEKKHTHSGTDFTVGRAAPKQLCIIRDLSGSGKTTLAVQLALHREKYFGLAKAALQESIDDLFDQFQLMTNDKTLFDLVATDRPLMYVVDSLDEASNHPSKHREIRGLLKEIDALNEKARSNGYVCYPLGIIFTVREDFWREWESLFEGLPVNTFLKRFSYFTPEQTQRALSQYSSAYGFRLTSGLDKTSLRVLSQPFNMQIFSEANEYRGDISTENVLDENVLSLYFERKKEDILKRPIVGFTPAILMSILSRVAIRAAETGENRIPYDAFASDITSASTLLSGYAEQIIRSISSEQILIRDSEDVRKFRFLHMRFVEYLVAYHIASRLEEMRDPQELDLLVARYVRGDFISLYYVHEFLSFICRTTYPAIYRSLTDYYSQSSVYVGRLLTHRRADIASGERTTTLDLEVIKKASANADGQVLWDSFFVIAAKGNMQDKDTLLEAFDHAWVRNAERIDRWRLLAKLGQHRLILEEKVIQHMMSSEIPKDWLVFVEEVIRGKLLSEFKVVWAEVGGEPLIRHVCREGGADWIRVQTLLSTLYAGKCYELGSPC